MTNTLFRQTIISRKNEL